MKVNCLTTSFASVDLLPNLGRVNLLTTFLLLLAVSAIPSVVCVYPSSSQYKCFVFTRLLKFNVNFLFSSLF